jgi:hypothetical protein
MKDTCQGLSPDLNGGSRHKAAMIHLFWVPMCKGEAHGDFDLRTMPADSNLLNSALATCNFTGSRQRDFAKTGGWLPVWIVMLDPM